MRSVGGDVESRAPVVTHFGLWVRTIQALSPRTPRAHAFLRVRLSISVRVTYPALRINAPFIRQFSDYAPYDMASRALQGSYILLFREVGVGRPLGLFQLSVKNCDHSAVQGVVDHVRPFVAEFVFEIVEERRILSPKHRRVCHLTGTVYWFRRSV